MDKIDFKKKNKELYLPKTQPEKIMVPPMNFIMVDGKGNPNEPEGEYQKAVGLLYAFSFTIKMNLKKTDYYEGFYDYVIPPLESLWWLNDNKNIDFSNKDKYCWTAMIRQPDFVTDSVFLNAKEELSHKKPELDISKARLSTYSEGLCIQVMHIGPYDEEPQTIEKIKAYINTNNLHDDIGSFNSDGTIRRHHEIYLSDPRKVKPENMKTILRHPVRATKA